MQHAQGHAHALAHAVDAHLAALEHGDVRAAEVAQGGDDGDARGVEQAAVVRQDVHVGAHGPAFGAGDDAERFRVEGGGASDGFFEEAREERFGGGWAGEARRGGLVLVGGCKGCWGLGCSREVGREGEGGFYRPTSKAGEAMGESSVVTVKMPSNLRSGNGCVMVAEIRAMTLWV